MSKDLARPFVLILALAALVRCSSVSNVPQRQRIAVPPAVVSVFSRKVPATMADAAFVPLRPYDRARDLEVLLLSSGSTAFTGMVVPGRSVFLLKQWVRPLPPAWLDGVRPDVAAALKSRQGALALPLSLDGTVLVYRADWWCRLDLPVPASLGVLRDDLLSVRSSMSGLERPVMCQVSVDELFWDLAWSFEGRADPVIYSYPKVHVLQFIQEFDLSARGAAPDYALTALLNGKTAAVFSSGRDVLDFFKRHPAAAKEWTVAPIPSSTSGAICIYNGLCLVRPALFKEAPQGWDGILRPAYQHYMDREGLEPVLDHAVPPPTNPVWKAFQATRFYPPPTLGEMGNEFVHGAILDATEASLSPEEALRRAAARLRLRGGGGTP